MCEAKFKEEAIQVTKVLNQIHVNKFVKQNISDRRKFVHTYNVKMT